MPSNPLTLAQRFRLLAEAQDLQDELARRVFTASPFNRQPSRAYIAAVRRHQRRYMAYQRARLAENSAATPPAVDPFVALALRKLEVVLGHTLDDCHDEAVAVLAELAQAYQPVHPV